MSEIGQNLFKADSRVRTVNVTTPGVVEQTMSSSSILGLSTTVFSLVVAGGVVFLGLVVLVIVLVVRKRKLKARERRVRYADFRRRDDLAVNYINGNIGGTGGDVRTESTEDIMALDNDNYLMSLETMMYTNPYVSSSSGHRHSRF